MQPSAAGLLEQEASPSIGSGMREAALKQPQPRTSTCGAIGYGGTSSELSDVEQLWDQLRQKDAQILQLQKKLSHFRGWVSSIHAKVQQVNPQAIKNSRRLYFGGIPPNTGEDELKVFLSNLMIKCSALTQPGNAIISCKITQEKSYAFVEFRSVEETSNAMAFDGVAYKDTFLKIRRPSNYDVGTAMMLGPTTPDPTMDTSQLEMCRTVVEDSPHKLFVGGLPCDWTEDQVKELLVPFGSLRSFNLVMDKSTGKSKGYSFCEYADETVTEHVIRSLSQKKVGSKSLTVKRALEGNKLTSPLATMSSSGQASALPTVMAGTHLAPSPMGGTVPAGSYPGLYAPSAGHFHGASGSPGSFPLTPLPPTPPRSYAPGAGIRLPPPGMAEFSPGTLAPHHALHQHQHQHPHSTSGGLLRDGRGLGSSGSSGGRGPGPGYSGGVGHVGNLW